MVTQKSIAKQLGISPSLVSRALCGTAEKIGASEETVRKIRETALSLGYAPDAAARTLRGAKSQTIGVIIKDFDDPFLGRMTGELQHLARQNGYSLLLTGFDRTAGQPCDSASLLRFRLDALIICGSDICGNWIAAFRDKNIPIVQIGADRNCKGVRRVETDEAAGLELLVTHILDAGHRRIGFIGSHSGPHRRRRQILEKLLSAHGLTPDQISMVSVTEENNPGLSAMGKLLHQTGKQLPTVVLAADDSMAQGALRAIYNAGLSVPQDISLTGIDDIPAAELMIPALTTVRSPVGGMVRTAFAMVFATDTGERIVRMRPELSVRESCRKLC